MEVAAIEFALKAEAGAIAGEIKSGSGCLAISPLSPIRFAIEW